MRIIQFLILFIFITSCSMLSKSKEDDSLVVNAVTEKSNDLVISSEDVSITKNNAIYKAPNIAILLGPGANRTIAYASIIKELHRNNIKPNIISGTETGAIVAALIANGNTPERIEWFFYKLFREIKGEKIFSKNWQKKIYRLLRNEFKDSTKIENFKIKLTIPVYDSNTNRIIYQTSGNLIPILMANLCLYHQKYFATYSTPIQKEVFNEKEIRAQGADIIIGIDVLGRNINFLDGDEYLINVYTRAYSLLNAESGNLDLFFSMTNAHSPLDDTNMSILQQNAYKFGDDISISIKEKIDSWKNRTPDNFSSEDNLYEEN